MFTVYSTDGVTKFNHGDCKRYIQAASLARIVRQTFPDRIVLVDIPVNYRPAQEDRLCLMESAHLILLGQVAGTATISTSIVCLLFMMVNCVWSCTYIALIQPEDGIDQKQQECNPPSAGFLMPATFVQVEQSTRRKAHFPRIPQHQAIEPQQQGNQPPAVRQSNAIKIPANRT